MARSLDGLIRHLLDQTALCGEHGALPSDFVAHVKSYYENPTKDSQAQDGDQAFLHPSIASKVDRPFLEQVWKWLVRNSDIQLGSHAEHKQLTLSEVEARNAAIEKAEHSEQSIPIPIASSHVSNGPANVQDSDSTQSQHFTEIASTGPEDTMVLQNRKFNAGIRLYASKNRMWQALTGHGPDSSKVKSLDFICLSIIAACGAKGILQHDLVRISGQDKRSLPARTDRLNDCGYVEKKRVSVQLFNPKRLLHTSQCTLKRFVNKISDEKQQTSGPGFAPTNKVKRVKKKGQKDRSSQASSQSFSTVAIGSVSSNTAALTNRKIPSWTVDRSINNQIFELVDQAGIKGMSMTEIRDNLMGDHIKKPLDEYVSRLVQSWQISQPLHIRHLAIVRDTVLKGKTQIYMYYTYENFKKLVEGGTGFWEAVTTIPSGVRIGTNVAASLDAKPDVDEYGFPRLEEGQFEGRHNDATLEECISALKVDPLHISANDPVLKRQADGSYGVVYKGQQQHSVNMGNESSPKRATSTLSQAALIKASAVEPQKAALSKPLGAPSTKTHILGEKIVASNSDAVSAGEGIAETQIQKRKRVRKPDSKPLGRPRKYPKTRIPANFDTMTQDEVDVLFHSQEMFEKYEIIKIEKEIVRRIEDGENAVTVAYEVLAACENSRKQDGELPLPTASRAQVLHNFAGEPTPEPDTDETKYKGQIRKDTQYQPSMAAHTYFVPASQKQALSKRKIKKSREGPPILRTRTRRRGQRVSDLESRVYLPSVAAHSWPYVCPPSLATDKSTAGALQNDVNHRNGRIDKPKQLPGLDFKYLPSIAAHSGLSLPPDELSLAKVGQKRKRTPIVPLENDEKHNLPPRCKYLPSMAAHSNSFSPPNASHIASVGEKRKRTTSMLSRHDKHYATPSTSSIPTQEIRILPPREALMEDSNVELDVGNEGMYPGWKKYMSKYYQRQSETITRSNTGVFVGKTMPRRKRPCEPQNFRPTHLKLAVFKFTRLSQLDWSVKETTTCEQVSHQGSKAQTPTPQVAEPTSRPFSHSMSEDQSDLTGSKLFPLLESFSLGSQPTSRHSSPDADEAGTKRKRTKSPQPTRGMAPFDPFSASSYSRQSSPITESISRPGPLPQITALSPAIDQVHGKLIVETGSHHTLEREADTNESSGLTPNAPILVDSNRTQSKSATNQDVQPSLSSTANTSKPSNKQTISKLSRRGGSTAMLRKNIVMEIVEKCEGVFPSHKEMSSPFAAEWKRRGQEGTPESKTISNAVNALIKENRLRQITFTSQTRQGIAVTKSMLILPTIDNTDPRVKEAQTNMVAYHPRHFIPMAVLPPQESPRTDTDDNEVNIDNPSDKMTEGTVPNSFAIDAAELHRIDLTKKMMDGKERAAMNRLRALKKQDQQEELGHAYVDQPSTEPSIQRATADMAHAKPGPGRKMLPKATGKGSGGRRGQKRVERLASVTKPVLSQIIPLPIVPVNPVNKSFSLTWLPPNCAFSDFSFEEHRPNVLMAADGHALQIGTSETPLPFNSSDKSREHIRKNAENATRFEQKPALANSTRSSLLPTSFNFGQITSPYAPVRPPSFPRQDLSRIATFDTPRLRNQAFAHTRSHHGEAILDRAVRPVDYLGPEKDGPEEKRQVRPTSKTTRRESLNSRASPSSEPPLSCGSEWPFLAHAGVLGMSYQRTLLVSFMDPVHYIHHATGTFSVSFSGLQPPRKILANRATALNSFAANTKAVKPYSSYGRSTWPSSLQDSQKPKKTSFGEEVDDLLRKELDSIESNNVVLVGWPFVNHVFAHAHQIAQMVEPDMEAVKQVTVRLKDGRLISKSFPGNSESRPRTGNSIFSTGSRCIDPGRAPLKRRRLTSVMEHRTRDATSKHVDLDYETRPAKLRRVRGPREARSLGENGEERLLVAVMVIRALTGGLEKRIDWVLVSKVFEPNFTQMFVHSRWNLTLQKYKLVLPKMELDFQSIFTSAYADGTVPAIDYDSLEEYDWKWLVEWTMANVDTPTQSMPQLPMERSEFDRLYTLNGTSNNEINEVYEIDGSSALARRMKIVHRDPYVLPLVRERRRGQPAEDAEDFDTVKSWIRANIMTPESTYNPSGARAKLSTFPDRMVEDALKQLLLDRVLTQENKGRLVPGRNYDISDFLISRLKKNLQCAHFHRAATYKQQLDHEFEKNGFAKYSQTAGDGDMVVIVNLLAHQRITVVPIDVPMNKWGQTDGGYETRQMDKRRLNFSLELRPSPTYIYGDPLTPLPAPPSQHLQDPMAKIPLWYDIHGSLVPVMWEMALAAVVAVLAVRPGIGALELEKVMRPAMETWELQVVLEWLVNANAAKQSGQGFSVEDEWWWLALGTGENVRDSSGEDVGYREGRVVAEGKENGKESAEDVITMGLG